VIRTNKTLRNETPVFYRTENDSLFFPHTLNKVRKLKVHLYLIFVSLIIFIVTTMPNATSTGNKFWKANLTPLHSGAVLTCLVTTCSTTLSKVRSGLIDVCGNIVLFIPFGALVAIAVGPKRPRVLLSFFLGLLLSIAIELIQLQLPTRTTDVDDVIFNTIGTFLGARLAVGFWFEDRLFSVKGSFLQLVVQDRFWIDKIETR
jgi:glycopeptide antibiotics resistance protein